MSMIQTLHENAPMLESHLTNTNIVEPLELLHIDLCELSSIDRISCNKYIIVIVDDFFLFM